MLQYIPGQTTFGVFTNLFDRIDRETCGCWYLAVHVGPYRLTLTR